MKQAAVELSSAGGPLVIREGLCGLISTASLFLLPSPSSLSPGLSTPCRLTESNCCSQALCGSSPGGQPLSLTCLKHSLVRGAGNRGVEAEVLRETEATPSSPPSARYGKIPVPEEALLSRWAIQALWAVESSPHQQSFPCERGLALLTAAPNPCQQHFKLWPAQCYILTGQALLA